MPQALNLGITHNEFWHDEPYLLISYFKAHEIKLKREIEEFKTKTNITAWINGIYIQNAVASVLSKNSHYPQKPFELFNHENKNQQEAILENESAIKERSKIINQMVNKK